MAGAWGEWGGTRWTVDIGRMLMLRRVRRAMAAAAMVPAGPLPVVRAAAWSRTASVWRPDGGRPAEKSPRQGR